jgi:hypothetical protein
LDCEAKISCIDSSITACSLEKRPGNDMLYAL